MRVFINYKQGASPDHDFARDIENALRGDGHRVFRDETDLVPSETWPARLEEEIRACDAMVSLISNAALKSKWVLNEIDQAIELEKRIVPVVLEEIDPSLRFQSFRPRFSGTQYLKSTTDRGADLERLLIVLKEKRYDCYHGLISAKLREDGVSDAGELLEALCGVLFQAHWPASFLDKPLLKDDLPNVPPPASLAHALLNHVHDWARISRHNSETWRKSGDEARSKRLTWQSQRLACFATILTELISAWDRNSAHRAIAHFDQQEPLHLFDDSDGEKALLRNTQIPYCTGRLLFQTVRLCVSVYVLPHRRRMNQQSAILRSLTTLS